jgi:hypothetical protein
MIYHGQYFPSIAAVAQRLREISENVEGECDVRLQVYPGGNTGIMSWTVRFGPSDYDQDHTGFWGASAVPGVYNGKPKRFGSRDVARDLIEQARDHYASR